MSFSKVRADRNLETKEHVENLLRSMVIRIDIPCCWRQSRLWSNALFVWTIWNAGSYTGWFGSSSMDVIDWSKGDTSLLSFTSVLANGGVSLNRAHFF